MAGETNKLLPTLSFYSGGGFLDMGFEAAGFKIVWTNEIDRDFARFHAAGITSWRKSRGNGVQAEIFNTDSIEKIPSSQIVAEAFGKSIPTEFGIIGGPPCQDFSIRGSRKGFRGSKGRLTKIFLNKIVELKPTFFVMENVKGLLEHETYLHHLFKKVKKHYDLDHKTLNALEFGVPQSRERVFFVGIRKDTRRLAGKRLKKLSREWFNWPTPLYRDAATEFQWPEKSKFGATPRRHPKLPIKLCVKSCLVPDYNLHVIANSSEYFNLYTSKTKLNAIKEGETTRPSFKRLHRFKYSPTSCYGNNEVHLHPHKNRRISVREALRIQGVSDAYVLPSDGDLLLSKRFKMIGNGVPVPLAEAVANAVKNEILKRNKTTTKNGSVDKGEAEFCNEQNPKQKHKARTRTQISPSQNGTSISYSQQRATRQARYNPKEI
jgi:DNA (cytosine-5)-methyltransferase 1